MKNKIISSITLFLMILSLIANAQNIEKRYQKAMLSAKTQEERQKLYDDFMPGYIERMHKKYPDKMDYWGYKEWIDYNLQNSDFVVEGKLLEHPSAFQTKFDSSSKKTFIYRSIIITKILKGINLKIGDVIQVEKEYSILRGGGRDQNEVNHSVPLMLFLNKSNIKFLNTQYSDYNETVFAPIGIFGILEKGNRNSINNIYNSAHPNPYTNSEISFDTSYKFLQKKHKINITDTFDITDPVKYSEILKRVNSKLNSTYPLKNENSVLPKTIKAAESPKIDTANLHQAVKPALNKQQQEFWNEHDRLFKGYLQYKLDSAKTPGLKWTPDRTKIWQGRKLKPDTGTFITPIKSTNQRIVAMPINVVPLSSPASMTFAIQNIKNTSTTTLGINTFEFDVTGTTNTSGVFHMKTLHHFSYNTSLFGSNLGTSPTLSVTHGALFSIVGNNYNIMSSNTLDPSSFAVSQIANAVSVTGTGTSTSAIFNLVSLPANQTVVLYHVAITYNIYSVCGLNTMIDFTNTFFTSLIISGSYAPTQQGNTAFSTYSPIVHTPAIPTNIPLCIPSISGIAHISSVLNNTGVRAGSDDYIIISGKGFGDSITGITFKNANDGGLTDFTSSEDIISWTDTEIRTKVPTLLINNTFSGGDYKVAGSGVIKIKNSLGNETTSTQSINVPYAFNNFKLNGSKYKQNLVRQNCINGIEFTLSSSIPLAMRADVERVTQKALLDWSTTLGLDFRLQKAAGVPVYSTLTNSADDGINLISYKPLNGIDMGTKSIPKLVNTNNGILAAIYDNDIEINSKITNWNYIIGSNTLGARDFYITILHEIGHAIGLDHVINTNKELMYFKDNSLGVASERATLVTSTNSVIGALDIKTTSSAITWYPQLGTTSIGTLGSTTPTPVIYSNYPTPTICGLTAQLNSSPNLNNYQWRNNGVNIPTNLGGTTAYYNISTAGKYDLVGSLNGCTVVSNVLTITQIGRPVVNTNVAYSAVPYCVGTMSVTSNSNNTYRWFYPSTPYFLSASNQFTGQTGASFLVALDNIPLTWRVNATNCAGTSTTFVPVNAKTGYVPNLTISESLVYSNGTTCNYASNLTANATNGATSYQWYRNDSNVWVTATGWNTQTIVGNYSSIRKDYKVDATNACGTASSATIRLKTICAGCSMYVNASNCPNGLREELIDSSLDLHSGIETIKLYPNPATTELSIEAENEINGIEITNTIGTILIKDSFYNQRVVKLDFTNLAEGVYVCKICTNNEMVIRKIVVSK